MGEALMIVLTSPRNLDDLAQYCAKQEAGTMPTWTNAKLPSGRIALINLDNVSLIVPKGSRGIYVYFIGAKDDKVAVEETPEELLAGRRAPGLHPVWMTPA